MDILYEQIWEIQAQLPLAAAQINPVQSNKIYSSLLNTKSYNKQKLFNSHI